MNSSCTYNRNSRIYKYKIELPNNTFNYLNIFIINKT